MKKHIGSIFLVAGTCIGSGMIALPLVLSKLGLIPSIVLMLIVWALVYFTSLVNLELNLQAGKGLSLGALGRHFSGKIAETIGVIHLKILSYALLAVYIYGGSSILYELFLTLYPNFSFSLTALATVYTLCVMAVLFFPFKIIDYINRVLFFGLLIIVSILIVGLFSSITWANLPLFSPVLFLNDSASWTLVLPVLFTSFGFQVIFHTLTNQCNKDKIVLKRAFYWGSLIPVVVYMMWTSSVLNLVFQDNPEFYHQMALGKVDVGGLIKELTHLAKWPGIQALIWCISFLAIFTSVIGVGLGLRDSLGSMLSKTIANERINQVISVLLTVLPAYGVVIFVPNAFISVLGFAGMILVIIAILLPVYLFYTAKFKNLYYPVLQHHWLIALSVIAGIMIIGSELFNMLH